MPFALLQNSNARQLVISLKNWAGDHDGRYPPTLQELVNASLLEQEDFMRLAWWSAERNGELEPLIYLGAQLNDSSKGELPLIVSPRRFTKSGRWMLARNDGSVALETDEEYQRLMAVWHQVVGANKDCAKQSEQAK